MINVRAMELSARLDIPLLRWQEDGLGDVNGFGCRLSSGLVLLVEEAVHAVQYLGATGPTIYVESMHLAARGIAPVISEVIAGLHLSTENLTWYQTEEGLKGAAERSAQIGSRGSENGG